MHTTKLRKVGGSIMVALPPAILDLLDLRAGATDPTEGREQRGYRPVLVISATAFNEATKLPVILPITSGGDFGTTGVVRCDQPGLIDLQVRHGRKVNSLPPAILEDVLAKVRPIFD